MLKSQMQIILSLFVFLTLIIEIGCAKINSRTNSDSDTTGDNGPVGTPAGEIGPIFPHAESWRNPASHGARAQSSLSDCLRCHKPASEQEERIPACSSCHPNYPHGSGWREAQNHGAFVLNNGKSNCTTSCHGSDLGGGLSGVSCGSCHTLYPHNNQWRENHGATVGQLGRAVCQDCHENADCNSCHADYPHPERAAWLVFAGGHGEKVQTAYRGETSSCTLCHGTDLKRVIAGENCSSCHPSFPHPDQWGNFSGHGDYTLQNSKTECQLCHGSDYQGGSRRNNSCFSCHSSYPHLTGWRQASGQPQAHGDYVNQNGNSSCATEKCHGTALMPVPEVTRGPDCHSCHSNTYPHPAGWKGEGGAPGLHGSAARGDISRCKTCHGNNLDRTPAGSRSCVQCHASYPRHESAGITTAGSWESFEGHGQYMKDNHWDRTECQICHGQDDLGRGLTPSCKSCHASFPHTTPDWVTTNGHPVYISDTLHQDKTACKLCHGNDLMGGHSEVSCQACHEGFQHPDPNWATGAMGRTSNVHATTFIDRIDAGETWACQECHGINYERCANAGCHPAGVTHKTGWSSGSSASGHGKYFSTTRSFTSASATFCSDCHGNPTIAVTLTDTATREFLNSQSDCYECHWAYPHKNYRATRSSETWLEDWLPATRPGNKAGHVLDLLRSPLVTNSAGIRPPASSLRDLSNTTWPGALQNTCGGSSSGSCHYNGNRSLPTDADTVACGQYCHINTGSPADEHPVDMDTDGHCSFCHSIH